MTPSLPLKAGSIAMLLIATPLLNAQQPEKPTRIAHSVNLARALDELDRDFGDEDAAGDKWNVAPTLFKSVKNVRATKNGYKFNLKGKRTTASSALKTLLADEGWTVIGESLAARTFTMDLARNGELLSIDITENADRLSSRVSALHFIAKISRTKANPVKSSLISFDEKN